ncbi:MAG: hypothetical protein H6524_15505 [Actinobacteria bacterium]|jgi:hypothetical protein|nr:hypothetical protein [Actinomycetota bacterium]
MATLRNTAASVVAASAVLLTSQPGVATAEPVAASQGPQQGFRAAADIAADVYREERRSVLARYGEASREAQDILAATLQHAPTSAQRQAAWSRYKASTAQVRAEANSQMKGARESFRNTVSQARRQFGLEPTVTAGTLPGGPLWTARETAGA